MSDLPSIKNGHDKLEISYGGEPVSHFHQEGERGAVRSRHQEHGAQVRVEIFFN